MTTTKTTITAKLLTEAHHTLQDMKGHFAMQEAFTEGLAAGDTYDRPGVDQSIARLTAWSEYGVHRARIAHRSDALQDAAIYARAARIVWAYYVHHEPS